MKNIAFTLCALLLLLPGCGGEAVRPAPKPTPVAKVDVKEAPPKVAAPEVVADEAAADPNAEKVNAAATVAREIAANPEHADEVLTKHGLDRAKLDAMMFEIAADPALTEAYMAARKAS